MLIEARRRRQDGQRVAVAWVERHGRAETKAQLGELDLIAPITTTYGGTTFAELDVSAVLSLRPDAAVVDELAHSWPDGRRRRWGDVAALLAAGIDVLTSVNVANLESTRDYAARITGVGALESVPDEFVRHGEVILVDLPADALRSRIAEGKVLSADQVGGALSQYFRVANLEALSELGRAWLSGSVDQEGEEILARRGVTPLTTRPVVIAGVSDSVWGEAVILRAAQLACDADSDLEVVHARIADGNAARHPKVLDQYRQLTEDLGGRYIVVPAESPARALASQASIHPASTRAVVVGRHRSRLSEFIHGSVPRRLRRLQPEIPLVEVHERSADGRIHQP
jgi:two-component system sensor histidine kinase KdpD